MSVLLDAGPSLNFLAVGQQNVLVQLTASGRIEILDDTLKVQSFSDAVSRISGIPAVERARSGSSLGEIMVLGHASVLAQAGQDVFVLMDDGDGRRRARAEQDWLAERATGRLTLWSTYRVVREASGHPGWIVNGLTWQAVYTQMRKFDDGLQPLPLR